MDQHRADAYMTPVRNADADAPDHQKDNRQRSQDHVIDQKTRPDCRQQRDQLSQAEQQDSFFTSLEKAWAQSLIPSACVR